MRRMIRLLIGLASLSLIGFCGLSSAGSLKRAEVERLFDGQFVVGEVDAKMPVYPLFEKNGSAAGGKPALRGYAFETIDFKPVRGYSGKPINVLVAMDLTGTFIDLRLLEHREPFFSNPTGTARLQNFVLQYADLSVRHSVRVLDYTGQTSRDDQTAELQGVKHGTVSAASINRTVLESAAEIAITKLGMNESTSVRRRSGSEHFRRLAWETLLEHGMARATTLTRGDIERKFANTRSANRDSVAIDHPEEAALIFHVALLTQPLVGRSLIDSDGWRYLNGNRRSAHLLLVTESGPLSQTDDEALRMKNAMPFAMKQDGKNIALKALPYEKSLAVPGYPDRTLAHILLIDKASGFDPTKPFELEFLLARKFGTNQVFNNAEERHFPLAHDHNGWRAKAFDFIYTDWPEIDWVKIWISRAGEIAILITGLALLVAGLVKLRWFSETEHKLTVLRTAYLVFTLGFIGWFAQGQLTVINVTAAAESLASGGDLSFMLNDPMTVILWIFTGVTLLFWGRSTFCGWLCPFGALQELVSMIARAAGAQQRRLRSALDKRLKLVKYGVLGVIVVSSFTVPSFAEMAIKIEPFETAISFFFMRDWPYVLWAAVCLTAGIVVYRGYCRYICPLGAALACMGLLRRWQWLPRRSECGSPCQSCRHRCEYQAIHADGKIDYAECFQCLDCVAIYQDQQRCLPLIRENRTNGRKFIEIRRARGAG